MPNKNTRKLRGGCGCNNNSDKSIFLKGGSSLDVAINQNSSVIPYNNSVGTVGGDPNDPSNIVDVRMQPNMNSPTGTTIYGGKNKKSKGKKTIKRKVGKKSKNNKRRKTHRKIKGGTQANPITPNAIQSFGSLSGLGNTYNILSGNSTVDSSPLVQPIGTSPYGPHNPALV